MAVEFVQSRKTRRRFNSHPKCTVRVSTSLRRYLPYTQRSQSQPVVTQLEIALTESNGNKTNMLKRNDKERQRRKLLAKDGAYGGVGSKQAGGRRIVFTSPNWLSRSRTFAGSMLRWVLLHI